MLWWLSSALAAPPAGVDPDDLDHWEARAKALLDGPSGCWEISGALEMKLAGYLPPTRWGRPGRHDLAFGGRFTGRIEGGEWTVFTYRLEPREDQDGIEDLEVPILPLMGRMDSSVPKRERAEGEQAGGSSLSIQTGEAGDAFNVVHHFIDELDPATATTWAHWDEDQGGVVLFEDVPLSEGARAETVSLVTYFPGGEPYGTRLDVQFPKRFKVGEGWVRPTLFDTQAHLRAQRVGDEVLPALESLSLAIGALGYTIGYEQRMTYTSATRCVAGAAEPAAEVAPAAEAPVEAP